MSDRSAQESGVAQLIQVRKRKQVTFAVEKHQVTFAIQASIPRGPVPEPILVVYGASEPHVEHAVCLVRIGSEWIEATSSRWIPGYLHADDANRFAALVDDNVYHQLATRYGIHELIAKSLE